MYYLVGVRSANKQADSDQHGVLQQVRWEGGPQETGQEDDCSGQRRDWGVWADGYHDDHKGFHAVRAMRKPPPKIKEIFPAPLFGDFSHDDSYRKITVA